MKAIPTLSATAAATASSDAAGAWHPGATPQTTAYRALGSELRLRSGHEWTSRLAGRVIAPEGFALDVPAQYQASVEPCGSFLRVTFEGSTWLYPRGQSEFGAAFACLREILGRFAHLAAADGAYHAASFSFGGAGALILGAATAGKTVLALHLASLGAQFCGDETVMLDCTNHSFSALGRRPMLREPALPLLPSDFMRRTVARARHVWLPAGRLFYALTADELGGIEPHTAPQPLRTLLVIRERGPRAELRPIGAQEMLTALIGRALYKPGSLSALARISRMLRDVRGFSVVLGPPDQSAELIREAAACA